MCSGIFFVELNTKVELATIVSGKERRFVRMRGVCGEYTNY